MKEMCEIAEKFLVAHCTDWAVIIKQTFSDISQKILFFLLWTDYKKQTIWLLIVI